MSEIDNQKFSVLVDNAYKKALSLGIDKEDAKDIAQEAALKITEKIRSGKKIDNVSGYLAKTVENLIRDFFRRNRERTNLRLKENLLESGTENQDYSARAFEEAEFLEYVLKQPLPEDIKEKLDLTLTPRQREALEVYCRNILLNDKADYKEIGKQLGIGKNRAWELVHESKDKILLSFFVAELMNGRIDQGAVEALVRDWRKNPLRHLLNKLSVANPDDPILLNIKRKADVVLAIAIRHLEALMGEPHKINPKQFFLGYNYLYMASLLCWEANQKRIMELGEEFVLKDPPNWLIRQVTFRANNLAGSHEFQDEYKEYLLRMIDNPNSMQAIQTTFYILHYFEEFDAEYSGPQKWDNMVK